MCSLLKRVVTGLPWWGARGSCVLLVIENGKSALQHYEEQTQLHQTQVIEKNLLAKSRKFWKYVLVELFVDSVVKCKYCSAEFIESKQKQLTILSGSQKIDLVEVVLAGLWAVDSLPMCMIKKSKESQNG